MGDPVGDGPAERWRLWLTVAMGARQAQTGEILTGAELARRSGLSRQLVSQILNGQAEGVSPETANRLAAVLGADPGGAPRPGEPDAVAAVGLGLVQQAAYLDIIVAAQRRLDELGRQVLGERGGDAAETLAPEQYEDFEDATADLPLEQRPQKRGAGE